MRIRLRTRVLLTFVLIIVLFGILGGALSAVMIGRTTFSEAQRRVSLDLRSAWSVFDGRLDDIRLALELLAPGRRVAEAYAAGDEAAVRREFDAIRRQAGLDFIGLTDARGRVIVRGLTPFQTGDDVSGDPLVGRALRGETAAGFTVLNRGRLRREGGDLAERAFIRFEPTPKARPREQDSESSGLVLAAAVPVTDGAGTIRGVLYAGVLLNGDTTVVDDIRSIVFEDRLYHGRHVGTATIFQWDVRIATNVLRSDGRRAVGTRVSDEVYTNVIERGQSWYDRAFVVNAWYISAYDPIRDVDGRIVGILYVGVLAKQYDDMRRDLWGIYGGFTLGLAVIVFTLGLVFAGRLTRSLARLEAAAGKIAAGDLDLIIAEPASDDEVRDLTRDFNLMAASLRDREERLKAANADLERLNANYLDMLGFVSHELKNTLGVIYTAARALDARIVGAMNEPQTRLVGSICRSIQTAVRMTRNYLDLSRIERGELRVDRRSIDLVGDVVSPVLAEFAEVAAGRQVTIETAMPETAPLVGDPALLGVVFKNLIDNALKYGRQGGRIRIGCRREPDAYHLEVWNEGTGLAPEQIDRLWHIWAESEPGHWIRFQFTLPVESSRDG